MPAFNPVAEQIMRLMRAGNTKGRLPMVESPELSQYLNESFAQKARPPTNSGNVVVPGADAFMPAGADMPPPISQDPWFDRMQEGQIYTQMDQQMDSGVNGGWPPGVSSFAETEGMPDAMKYQAALEGQGPNMRGAPSMNEMLGQGGGELFIWAEKNGQRFRLDGPFPDVDSAALQLARLQKSIDPRSKMTLSLAPDIMDT